MDTEDSSGEGSFLREYLNNHEQDIGGNINVKE